MRTGEKIVLRCCVAVVAAFLGACPHTGAQDVLSGSVSWEELFPEPRLQELVRTALDSSVSLVEARERVLQARAQLGAARMAFLPSLSLGPVGNLARGEERYGGDVKSYSLPLSASWELDINGKLSLSRKRALVAVDLSDALSRSIQSELVASVADYYYTLEMLDAKLAISRETAASWKENVRIMEAMMEAGMTNEASVSHTEANAWSIEATLHDLEYEISRTESALCALVGIPRREILRGDIRRDRLGGRLAEGVDAEALGNRPDVRAAELSLRECYYDVALAKASFYPSLTINGSGEWGKSFTSAEGWVLAAGASLVQPVLRRGQLRSALKVSQSRERAAQAQYRQTLLDAGAEVEDALALCRCAEAKQDIRENQILSLQRAVRSTEQLMRHSESTYLEVLTAQQSLLSARLLQITDYYDATRGVISLYKALGGGVQ